MDTSSNLDFFFSKIYSDERGWLLVVVERVNHMSKYSSDRETKRENMKWVYLVGVTELVYNAL